MCFLRRQLQRPLLLVKVMIPPLSPASISLYPSLCYLHIKMHLTSISAMESGASGWGLTTTQHLPPRLCCFSMPTVSCSRQSPAAPLLPPVSWQKASFLHERVTLSSASSVICTFLAALVKRLHVAESILNAEERKDTIINIWGCVQYVCFNHWPNLKGLWVQQQCCFQLFFPAPVEMFAHNKQPRRSWELHTCWRKKGAATGKKDKLWEDQATQE